MTGPENENPHGREDQPSGYPSNSNVDNWDVIEKLKANGNAAFQKAQLLGKTTAAKQYLQEAKSAYAEAISKIGSEAVNDRSMGLVCTLHSNLAATFLLERPSKWQEAKAAADIALAVDGKHVKALYRRAQAHLEDMREGLPEVALRAALADLTAAMAAEPNNAQVKRELERIRRRVNALEASRQVPERDEIVSRIPKSILDRGGDCITGHGYLWGQNAETVHVFVPAVGKRFRAADVQIEIKPNYLRLFAPAADRQIQICGKLSKPVRPDDCSWQVEDGGLLLHVELSKRVLENEADASIDDARTEHWRCVWYGHAQTKAPTAKERDDIHRMAATANRMDEKETKQEDPRAAETVRQMQEMFPGVNVEWGDTSLGFEN